VAIAIAVVVVDVVVFAVLSVAAINCMFVPYLFCTRILNFQESICLAGQPGSSRSLPLAESVSGRSLRNPTMLANESSTECRPCSAHRWSREGSDG
jgi:hypothetical protein